MQQAPTVPSSTSHPAGIVLPARAEQPRLLHKVKLRFARRSSWTNCRDAPTKTTAEGLVDWLHAHPSLYSLDQKDALAERLVHRLIERPALQPEQLRALLKFFDLDAINPRAERLQRQIELLYGRSAEASGDWSDVAYMYERPRSSSNSTSKSGGSWWP